MLGNKAIKFIIKIVVNIVIIIVSVLFSVLFIVNFTSFFIFIRMKLFRIEDGFFIFHIFVAIKVVTNIVVSQDRESIVDLGSKIENKFVIILFCFFVSRMLVSLLIAFA